MVLNKKGVIGDAFDFLTVVVASCFLWLVVSIVLVGPIEENKKITLENIDEVNSNLVLLNYLRTTTLNGQQVSDLIIAAEIDPKAQKNLESLTNKLILDSNNYLFKRIMIKYPKRELYTAIYPQSGSFSPYAETNIKGSIGFIKIIIHGVQKESETKDIKKASTGGKAS